ncbi:DUF1223 domain-containing protein [Mangrovicoccus algicola]|uniref:DUF1223 domain-containing protein n=1 Tax=Mangrovicoccus algicola TaxID=2771008 RepID=A0A8J6Z4U2_9RHOB|nr:DUF1223 domain-containing protein [Mangrovicoccus algicola]MBE3637674.1 DUF1223 domain-containing protein [Mangrovicoccus algicola]
MSLTLLGLPAAADPVVVLELYTSQGCSACPPADELLSQLATEKDVLAFSFHVDYWDYIGWTDTFGSREYGHRQKTYAQGFGERMVYTPQMIVQGLSAVVGHKAEKIEAMIQKIRAQIPAARVDAARDGDMLRVTVAPTGDAVPPSELYLLRYQPEATVKIGKGENAGRKITYTNIVTDLHLAEYWSGEAPEEFDLPVTGDQPVAVLLQERGQGPVIAAATAR